MAEHFVKDGKLDREALIAELRKFLDVVIGQTRLDVRYEIRQNSAAPAAEGATDEERPEIQVDFHGRDQDLLLQHNADLLNALEYLAVRWLHLEPQFYDHLRLDCADYRVARIEELKLSARVAAERVRESHQPFRLNPMSPRERRVVHLAIKDVPGVRSASEGVGDRRQVIIYPAEKT